MTEGVRGAWSADGSPSRARTCDNSINSRMLYQLSYRGPRRGRLHTALAGRKASSPGWRRLCLRPRHRLDAPVAENFPRTSDGRPVPAPVRDRSPRIDRPIRVAAIPSIDGPVREASWRSGYAEDCKSLHPGSIPGEASNLTNLCRSILSDRSEECVFLVDARASLPPFSGSRWPDIVQVVTIARHATVARRFAGTTIAAGGSGFVVA